MREIPSNSCEKCTCDHGMDTTVGHTPTPWFIDGITPSGTCTISSGEISVPTLDVHNAVFIVRAVNAHEELVDALKVANRMICAWGVDNEFPEWEEAKKRVQQAIARAEGK